MDKISRLTWQMAVRAMEMSRDKTVAAWASGSPSRHPVALSESRFDVYGVRDATLKMAVLTVFSWDGRGLCRSGTRESKSGF
jgi:hypothetical protein